VPWLSNNIGTVIAVIVAGCGLITTWVLYGADIRQLKLDRDQLKADLHATQEELKLHMANITIHLDPYRDERRWTEFRDGIFQRFDGFTGRFDGVDRKIERLMLHVPPVKEN
jgi:hypothetical protein